MIDNLNPYLEKGCKLADKEYVLGDDATNYIPGEVPRLVEIKHLDELHQCQERDMPRMPRGFSKARSCLPAAHLPCAGLHGHPYCSNSELSWTSRKLAVLGK